MPADPRLAALAALRKRAEEEAKALCEVCADTFALHMGADMPAMYERGWDGMHEDERDALTAANLALLSDLTRPASRDAVARIIDQLGDARDRDAAEHARDDAEALASLALAVLGGAS